MSALPAPYTIVEPELCRIGDITVTQHGLYSPTGSYPLAGTRWDIVDRREVKREVPVTCVLLAIFGIPFTAFFSLLFLLIKTERVDGFVEVSATGPGFHTITYIPSRRGHPVNMVDVTARVAYVRNLTAMLG